MPLANGLLNLALNQSQFHDLGYAQEPVEAKKFARDFDENNTGLVFQFAATDPEGQPIRWELSGDDADLFSIDGGALGFASSPDFESPADEDTDNVYDLTIGASDAEGNLTEVDVTVTITNVDEAGTVTLSSLEPEEEVRITATLADSDGIASKIRWQWARSTDGLSGWTNISGATTRNYTPVEADVGGYLRATANYEDRESTTVTKTVAAATDEPVVGIPRINRGPEFVNQDPTDRTVNENSAEAALVGDAVETVAADKGGDGASEGNRTLGLRFTKPLLYR